MGCALCETINWKNKETWKEVVCKTCRVPLVVFRKHSVEPDPEVAKEVEAHIEKKYPGAEVRKTTRSIKDHAHWHIYEKT